MAVVRRRIVGGIVVVAVAAFAAGCGGSEESSAPPTTASQPAASDLPLVSCDDSIGGARYSGTDDGARIVLGVISVPPAYVPEAAAPGGAGGWKYSAPADFVVRSEQPPFDLSVPKEWRDRVAISFGGTKPVPALRIPTCPNNGLPWNAFAVVFSLQERTACVPLTVAVGGKSETVRFGLGERCPKAS
jgi:hypothetical protein